MSMIRRESEYRRLSQLLAKAMARIVLWPLAGAALQLDSEMRRSLLRALGWSFINDQLSLRHDGAVRFQRRRLLDINLVDPASSHMLVSKIKPCMSQYKLLYGETANGSLKQL